MHAFQAVSMKPSQLTVQEKAQQEFEKQLLAEHWKCGKQTPLRVAVQCLLL